MAFTLYTSSSPLGLRHQHTTSTAIGSSSGLPLNIDENFNLNIGFTLPLLRVTNTGLEGGTTTKDPPLPPPPQPPRASLASRKFHPRNTNNPLLLSCREYKDVGGKMNESNTYVEDLSLWVMGYGKD